MRFSPAASHSSIVNGKSSIRAFLSRCDEGNAERSVFVAFRWAMGKRVSPIDRYVGSRVRLRRKMLDMSQQKLASALGLTFQQIQKYEKGHNRISAGRLQTIAQIMEVPVSYFYEDPSNPVKSP